MNCKEETGKSLCKLRSNTVLSWIGKLEKINKYKEIMQECTLGSTLEVESGIVKINPSGKYIGHELAPQVKAGFNIHEIVTIMKYKTIKFESVYGEVGLSDEDIEGTKQLIYMYNRKRNNTMDNKEFIHLEQTSEVLYYLLQPSIKLKKEINGWCSLIFTNENNLKKEYCTIFNEEQIELLERVSASLSKG